MVAVAGHRRADRGSSDGLDPAHALRTLPPTSRGAVIPAPSRAISSATRVLTRQNPTVSTAGFDPVSEGGHGTYAHGCDGLRLMARWLRAVTGKDRGPSWPGSLCPGPCSRPSLGAHSLTPVEPQPDLADAQSGPDHFHRPVIRSADGPEWPRSGPAADWTAGRCTACLGESTRSRPGGGQYERAV
jgi:hypothetical protein